MNNLKWRCLFNEKVGPPVFGVTMSGKRFSFIYMNIAFEDSAAGKYPSQSDKSIAVRSLYEQFNENCCSVVLPQDFVSLEETLYSSSPPPTEGSNQVNRIEIVRQGLFSTSLVSCRYPYTFRSEVSNLVPGRQRRNATVKVMASTTGKVFLFGWTDCGHG